jgi:hypothetical protein
MWKYKNNILKIYPYFVEKYLNISSKMFSNIKIHKIIHLFKYSGWKYYLIINSLYISCLKEKRNDKVKNFFWILIK